MFAPDVAEFAVLVAFAGLAAVCALAIATGVGLAVAFVVFRDHGPGVMTVGSGVSAPFDGPARSDLPGRETQPMTTG